MRKAIRLALPVVAAATALALTGCNDDDGEGSFGSLGGNSGGSEETTEDPGSTTGGEEDTGGDTGGETGDTGGDTGGSTTGGGGTGAGPTVEEMEGDWYTGTDPSAMNFEITAGAVKFYEDFDTEGDMCEGTYADGTITLTSCTQRGSDEWTDMAATVELVDATTIDVVWVGGQNVTMQNAAVAGVFSDAEITQLQETIARFNELP